MVLAKEQGKMGQHCPSQYPKVVYSPSPKEITD